MAENKNLEAKVIAQGFNIKGNYGYRALASLVVDMVSFPNLDSLELECNTSSSFLKLALSAISEGV
jgi:hypothetical protein